MNGKIKAQHLDPQFLLELKTGSASGDLSGTLENYIKKDDLIEYKQLNPNVFDAVSQEIETINTNLTQYRKSDIPIKETDLTTAFTAKISTMQQKIDGLQANSGVTEDGVNSLIAQYINNNQLAQTIETNIETNLRTNDLKTINDSISSINSINTDLQTSVSNLSNRVNDDVRLKTVKIGTSDLSDDISNRFIQYDSNISTLKANQNKVNGDIGQIAAVYDNNGTLASKNILNEYHIASNKSEFDVLTQKLCNVFYYLPSKRKYEVKLNSWNSTYKRNAIKENVVNSTVESGYQKIALTTDNVNADNTSCTMTISGTDIILANTNTTLPTKVSFGFYGTKIKLNASISSTGLSLNTVLDYKGIESISYDGKNLYSNICILCEEGLSEGAHVLTLVIPANTTITLISTIDIDDVHAALLTKTDMPLETYFANINNMYNGIDYFTVFTGTYANLKSDTLLAITDYDKIYLITDEAFSDFTFNKNFVYAVDFAKLYYFIGSKYIILTTDPNTTTNDIQDLVIKNNSMQTTIDSLTKRIEVLEAK